MQGRSPHFYALHGSTLWIGARCHSELPVCKPRTPLTQTVSCTLADWRVVPKRAANAQAAHPTATRCAVHSCGLTHGTITSGQSVSHSPYFSPDYARLITIEKGSDNRSIRVRSVQSSITNFSEMRRQSSVTHVSWSI